MKISARTCDKPVEKTVPEPDLELYLEDSGSFIYLKVRDRLSGLSERGNLLSMSKSEGKISRCVCVHPDYGLPLSPDGSLKLTTE